MEEKKSPWGTLFYAAIFLLIGIGGYVMFDKLEREGGSVRMPALAILAYKMLGKYGVLAVFGGIGGLMTISGIAGLVSGEKSDAPPADDDAAK
jgi:hypothetical protein